MDTSTTKKNAMQKSCFKIGACDWSLGRMDTGSFAVAKEIGLNGVQISVGTEENPTYLMSKDVQQECLAESKKQGVQISSLAIGNLNWFPYKSDSRAEQWVSDSIDVCQALKVNVVLLPFFAEGDLRGDTKGMNEVIRRLKKIAPKAEKAGVMLAIESWLSAWEHMDIIQRVGSKSIKVYYDVFNSFQRDYDIYEEIRFLGDNIAQFHAKDGDRLFGQGRINFPAVREAMNDIGYHDWLVMEESQPEGIVESYRKNAAYLRKIFS